MKRYEAMFLFDTPVGRDWSGVEQEVRRLLDRIGANLLVCVKFDERKLAYEIRRRKRGLYVLSYFEAPSERIGELERDAQLSEVILRLLVLRAENLTEEKLAELKAHAPETPLVPMAGDGRRHDDDRRGGWGERRGGWGGGGGGEGGGRAPEPEPMAVGEADTGTEAAGGEDAAPG